MTCRSPPGAARCEARAVYAWDMLEELLAALWVLRPHLPCARVAAGTCWRS